MKKIFLLLIILFGLDLCAEAKTAQPVQETDITLPNIFIWADDELNAATLKGYAEFLEADDAITLQDGNGFVLNIKTPQGIGSKSLIKPQPKPGAARYTYKNFSVNTTLNNSVNTKTGAFTSPVVFAPEYRLNHALSLQNVFIPDIVNERATNEYVLLLNPLGKKDLDRVRFEFAAGQTLDRYGDEVRNKLRFSTQIKL